MKLGFPSWFYKKKEGGNLRSWNGGKRRRLVEIEISYSYGTEICRDMEFIMECVWRRTTWWLQRVRWRRGEGRVNNWILHTADSWVCAAEGWEIWATHTILTIRALFVGYGSEKSLPVWPVCVCACVLEHVSWGVGNRRDQLKRQRGTVNGNRPSVM